MAHKKKVVWRWDWSVYMAFCPYCDEPAYGTERCEFCGKEFEWVEPKHKPTEVKCDGGYTVVQNTNRHIMIFDKDGKMVLHASCTKKKTPEELRDMVDKYLKVSEEVLAKIAEDGDYE